MTDQLVLSAEPREDVGKGASRRLRRLEKRVPGIIYGGDAAPQSVSLEARELAKAEGIEAFYSQVLELQLGGSKVAAVVKDLQRHPARGDIMHIDFLRVQADQLLTVNLSLHLVGEEECVGVKAGGRLSQNMNEVTVTALPAALPEYLEIDVSGLEAGATLHLSDITLPEGVAIPALGQGADHDQAIVSVIAARGGAAAAGADGEASGEEG
ncbi:MAG: 50S ribosomal protein L25/general stress protein Ctc [Pseudomonadales bacterium]|jgi:large subunit ribosomal protein L25|nr:50S ribosomal protein L25/general stress protein Ctc [Pseudomonadales bacterium]MBL6808015.1 50S ribosomal protein L25/general stress protein Ctc [Pseudomonadales bacterium]MDA0955515.1 50S ribosomal protein L25/general stress protein Ctc [Pseudomonadota bacterium]